MTRLRVALCQLNPVVGDLGGNAERIIAALGIGRGRRRRRGRLPRAGRHRLPARGPAAEARVRGRQPGRARQGGGRHRALRRRGRLRRRAARPLQRRRRVRRGRGAGRLSQAGCCPTTGCSTSSATSPPEAGATQLFGIGGVRVGVSICEDAWSPQRPDRRPGGGGRRARRQHQRLALLPGSPHRARADAGHPGRRRQLRARLRQLRRRPGRAGLRRRLAGVRPQRPAAGLAAPVHRGGGRRRPRRPSGVPQAPARSPRPSVRAAAAGRRR